MRRAHQAPRSTAARNRSGIASVMTSSSSRVAGCTGRARGGLDAARIRHGLTVMSSSSAAVFRTLFSSTPSRAINVR